MAERVHPAAKTTPHPPSSTAPQFPATKAQSYGRPPYRPQPPPPKRRSRSRRSCWCSCCLWITLILLALAFLAAIAGGIFYVLYRPHRPEFTVTSLRLSQFNLTKTPNALLTSRLDLTVVAKNPNKKISFVYNPVSVSVSSGGVDIGEGSFPAFVHGSKNTTVLRATVSSVGKSLDSDEAADLKKKKKSSLPLQIELDTKAGVKLGAIKTNKIGIRVSCDGFSVSVPVKKAKATATSEDVSCKVKLRIKIWKWTF